MLFILTIIISMLICYMLFKANQNTYHATFNHVEPYPLTNDNKPTQLHILHLSDIHLENLSITPEHLEALIKHEKIDLIALTGDFLDRKRSLLKLAPYLEVLNKINPKYGTFVVLGNHDYVLKDKSLTSLKKILIEHNCTVLQNDSKKIKINGKYLNIIGVDDFSTHRSDLEKSYQNLQDGYNLVLTHDPNIVLQMKNYHFDYLLAGHFHGGQICWPKPYHLVKMGKLVRLNMIKGLQNYDNKPFYISEGLGQTGINIRIGSTPEITMHHLDISQAVNIEQKVENAI